MKDEIPMRYVNSIYNFDQMLEFDFTLEVAKQLPFIDPKSIRFHMIHKDYQKLILSAKDSNSDFVHFDQNIKTEIEHHYRLDINKIDYNTILSYKAQRFNTETSNFLVGCLFK